MDRPVLSLGLDIGIRRDSTGLSAVYYDQRLDAYCLWGHMCWTPTKGTEVDVTEVTNVILGLCERENVVGLYYDEYQYVSESQRIRKAGYGKILHPINQQSENVAFSNNLKGHMDDGDFLMYEDNMVLNHFKWCAVEVTERGWRITKRKQTRPIDMVVSIAMALYGAAQTKDYHKTVFSESRHARSILTAA